MKKFNIRVDYEKTGYLDMLIIAKNEKEALEKAERFEYEEVDSPEEVIEYDWKNVEVEEE